MGLTFKINRPTGRYRSFSHHAWVDIKLNKEIVGYISWRCYNGKEGKRDGMRVTIHVKDENESCGWKNVPLIKSFEGTEAQEIAAAKEWLKKNWTVIAATYPIYPLTNKQPELL